LQIQKQTALSHLNHSACGSWFLRWHITNSRNRWRFKKTAASEAGDIACCSVDDAATACFLFPFLNQ
jgi:hypothetical protein